LREDLTRPEISPNNRAVCKDTICKKEKAKLLKGDIRFGTWVEVGDYPGSWSWKHWYVLFCVFCGSAIREVVADDGGRGCVSGAQIKGLRESLGTGGGEYDWDLLDGYDELK
jgi:hypothetical protein